MEALSEISPNRKLLLWRNILTRLLPLLLLRRSLHYLVPFKPMHTVDLHAAEGTVSYEARVRDSTNISDTVAVDSAVRVAPPGASDTGVLRKMPPPPKSILARPAERGNGSVFIPASSLFPATAPSNSVEPAQSKEIGDVMGQQCVAPCASKPAISPKPRTKSSNKIGVSCAAVRERLANSKSVEKVIEVPDSTPPAPVQVSSLDLAKSYLQKQVRGGRGTQWNSPRRRVALA